jgi:hypothetical protein
MMLLKRVREIGFNLLGLGLLTRLRPSTAAPDAGPQVTGILLSGRASLQANADARTPWRRPVAAARTRTERRRGATRSRT